MSAFAEAGGCMAIVGRVLLVAVVVGLLVYGSPVSQAIAWYRLGQHSQEAK